MSDLYGPEPVPISGFVCKFSCSLICDSHAPEPARKPSIQDFVVLLSVLIKEIGIRDLYGLEPDSKSGKQDSRIL